MAGETTVTVIGNLTADPELRYLESGVAMAKFTVASTPRQFDRTAGQYKDGEPLFMNCTAWRQVAEHAAESLGKGMRVVVVGRLRQSRWQTETGDKRSMIGLDVDEIGPSLQFATATVNKMSRTKAGDGFIPADADDRWATATPADPAGKAA
jgi:single-strand DNA-binding protein